MSISSENFNLMKTALCCKPKTFEMIDTLIKEPAENEVIVRLEGCGVCGSNLPVWDGRSWFEYPLEPGAPGHEGWGRVESLGKSVIGYSVHDRVAVLSSHAFAQFETVSVNNIVKIPVEMDEMNFPGEPLGCAMNVMKRSQIIHGQRVAVIGAGFLGLLLIQLAVKQGAKVIAISKRKSSLEKAQKYGADECLEFSTEVSDKVMRWSQNFGCDCVIEATGYQQSLDISGEIIKNNGHLIIAGYHQDGIRTVNLQQWNWKGIDVINAHERDQSKYIQGIKDAMDAIVNKTIEINSLFTHIYPLGHINSAFEIMKDRPDGFIKALVTI